MAQLIVSGTALADLERLCDFLLMNEPTAAVATTDLIAEALGILKTSPLIGRPAESGLHELVISRGRSGYIALYDFMPAQDAVIVLSIRHQREIGFSADKQP